MTDNSVQLTDTQAFGALSVRLTAKQELFCQTYAQGASAVDAYCFAYDVGAGTSRATARNNGYQLLRNPRVATRLRELQAATASTGAKSTGQLLAELEQMCDADVSEVVQLATGSCRHCHGTHGAYQWVDEREYGRTCCAALEAGKPLPDFAGGVGYIFDRDANPECTECLGAGIQRVRVTNPADCSPGARRLFKGVELFPDGSVKRVLLHDQMAARVELHRLKGMHIERSLSLVARVPVQSIEEIAKDPAKALDFLESIRPTAKPAVQPATVTVEPDAQ